MHQVGVGSIERFRRTVERHEAPARTDDVGFSGRPVDYRPSAYSFEESWQLLSEAMRAWVQSRAGAAIRDPHNGAPTVYTYCRVLPDDGVLLDGARGATYELVAFGKRGLVVSDGTSHHLVPEPGATKWRHHRFDLPIDPRAVRNDHRRGALSHSAPAGPGPAGSSLAEGTGSGLLPPDVADTFGNLPLATQQFLLEPFTTMGRPPTHARVHPAILERGPESREVFWTCLFNAGWLAFAYAERSVMRHNGGSSTIDALRDAPWTVAAWVAPIDMSAGAAGTDGTPSAAADSGSTSMT